MKNAVLFALFILPNLLVSQTVHGLNEVVDEVKIALQDIQNQLAVGELPPLSEVSIKFKTITKKTTSGSIKLFVFSFGKKRQKEFTNEVEIVLNPEPAGTPLPVSGSKIKISDQLVASIVSAAEAIKNIKDSPPKLKTSSVSTELKFVLTNSNTPGVSVELAPFTLGLEKTFEKSAVHTIKIKYSN